MIRNIRGIAIVCVCALNLGGCVQSRCAFYKSAKDTAIQQGTGGKKDQAAGSWVYRTFLRPQCAKAGVAI